MGHPLLATEPQSQLPLMESLLGVHGAPSLAWLADSAATASERGLGALYGLLYARDASGELVGERPASTGRLAALLKLQQTLGTDPTTLRFDPSRKLYLAAAIEEGKAKVLERIDEALPVEADKATAVQKQLGVESVIVAPLHWDRESMGALLLLMSTSDPSTETADLLGQHIAVAMRNLHQKEAGRKHGELDTVSWVYDEVRFREELAQEARRALRHRRPLSVLLLRVENLDELRARYGRFLGERLLRQVAGQLQDAMRDTDFLGACGDNAFATILVEADGTGARQAQSRLLAGLGEIRMQADFADLKMDFSCATATLPQDGESADDLLATVVARVTPVNKE